MSRASRLFVVGLVFFGEFLAAKSLHAETIRVAVAITDAGDAAGTTRDMVQSAVEGALASQPNLHIVDTRQLARLKPKHRTDASLLSALEADILVLGDAHFEPLGVKGLHAIQVTLRVRVVSSDSARIFKFNGQTVSAHGYTLSEARQEVARRASSKIQTELRKEINRRAVSKGRIVNLRLHSQGPITATTMSELVDSIRKIEGIEDVRQTYSRHFELQLAIETQLAMTRLAEALELLHLGLLLNASSPRQLEGTIDVGASTRVELGAQPFKLRGQNRKQKALDRSLAKVAPHTLMDILGQLPEIDPLFERKKTPPKPGRLVLRGSVQRIGAQLQLRARVDSSINPLTLVSVSQPCSNDPFECLHKLGEKLKLELPHQIRRHRRTIKANTPYLVGNPSPLKPKITALRTVIPAAYQQLSTPPGLGYLTLYNSGTTPLRNIQIHMSLDELSSRPSLAQLSKLAPGGSENLAITLQLSSQKILAAKEGQTHLRVKINYHSAPGIAAQPLRLQAPVSVHDVHTLKWSLEGGRAAAVFVTPDHPAIKKRVRSIETVAQPKDRFDTAAAMYAGLHGLRYTPDPAHPFDPNGLDRAAFAHETLAAQQGDCDDLGILYAALLEASGLPAMLVQIPGHILVAFESSFPPEAWSAWYRHQDEAIIFNNKVWIPVDVTRPSVGFIEAMNAGSKLVRTAVARLIPVRTAWREGYSPFTSTPPPSASPTTKAPPSDSKFGLTDKIVRDTLALRQLRRKHVQKEVQATSSSTTALAVRAATYLALWGEHKQASRAFKTLLQRVVKPSPTQAQILTHLGNLEALSDAEQALNYYDRAIDITPELKAPLWNAVLLSSRLSVRSPTHRKKFEERLDRWCQISNAACDSISRQMNETAQPTGDRYKLSTALRWVL